MALVSMSTLTDYAAGGGQARAVVLRNHGILERQLQGGAQHRTPS